MSRYPLRDISISLAGAPDLESALDSLLGYLRVVQGDWHPSVALFNSETECFEHIYDRERGRLTRRDVSLGLDHLPPRFVRKFVRPSAFFNGENRRSLLERLFQTSPGYEPDPFEGNQLQALMAPSPWRSCLCLPLNDRDELLGLIVLVSTRQKAFGPAVTEELQPLRGLASLSIARRLHATGRVTPEMREAERSAHRNAAALQQRVRELETEMARLAAESAARRAALSATQREAETIRQAAEQAAHEGRQLGAEQDLRAQALEEQAAAAGMHLSDAFGKLAEAQARLDEMGSTLEIVREAFDVIANDPDSGSFTRAFVAWFCDRFQAGRCSLMRVDPDAGDLRILAHQGMDPSLASRVRVAMGQGVSGWVATHAQAVLMRDGGEGAPVRPTGLDRYNSDSFISVPLVHRRRVVGVLNLSNKHAGEPFDALDLDRAQLASHVLAMALGAARDKAA